MPASAAPISVLIVDDFADVREMLAAYLTLRGFSVHSAADGQRAVELTRALRPDIILMNPFLPIVNGLEATRILKKDPSTRAIPIVATTSRALDRDIASARAAGCDAVISKPFDLTALADALPRVLTEGAVALDVPGLAPKGRVARMLSFAARRPASNREV